MGQVGKRLLERAGGAALSRVQRSLAKKTPVEIDRYGVKLGRWFYRVAKRRRERAVKNLALAFPAMPSNQRRLLALRVFEHFGRVSADFLASHGRTIQQIE